MVTVVGWNAVLAGDPKMFRLLCNTNLNMKIPSRGSEEERIRILLPVGSNGRLEAVDVTSRGRTRSRSGR